MIASTDFPRASVFGPGRVTADLTDAFVAKLNPEGTALVYATYLGGSDQDLALGLAVNSSGNVYLTGGTHSRDFPITAGAL
jgi:hypothetical protein